MLVVINDTFIVLIPKTNSHKQTQEDDSISLYDMIFKIASKIITNRMKTVLPNIIDIT